MVNIQPKYLSFITRVWLQVYKTILLFFTVITLGAFVGKVSLLYALLLGFLPVCVFLFSGAFLVNRYYLKSLSVDKEFTELVIYKYNTKFKTYRIKTRELNIKINQVLYSFHPYYKLQFHVGNKKVYQQTEGGQWTVDLLIEAYKEIKENKGEKAHVRWIKN